jgi:hypothetical protein
MSVPTAIHAFSQAQLWNILATVETSSAAASAWSSRTCGSAWFESYEDLKRTR